jgi:recombination protein RecT
MASDKASELRNELVRYEPVLTALLPKGMGFDRLRTVVMSAVQRNPGILTCSKTSILRSVLQSTELGLEAGSAMGFAYLVPYKGECTLVVGYQGLLELVRRSGVVRSVIAHAIYSEDRFECDLANGIVSHIPSLTGVRNDDAIIAFYAVATMLDGSRQVAVMSLAEVQAIRQRSAARNGPWVTDFAQMGVKTVLRRLCKQLPRSPEKSEALVRALEVDDTDADPKWDGPLSDGRTKLSRLANAIAPREELPPVEDVNTEGTEQ